MKRSLYSIKYAYVSSVIFMVMSNDVDIEGICITRYYAHKEITGFCEFVMGL
jgi:hypothetical protein